MANNTIGTLLFLFSAMFWIIISMIGSFYISRFIVPRYEKESNLLDSVFFQEHMPFTRFLPDFYSSAIYCGHLSIFIWGWKFYRNRKVFRDIKDPKEIVGHFSKSEISAVKLQGTITLIVTIHVIIFCIVKFFYPDQLPE